MPDGLGPLSKGVGPVNAGVIKTDAEIIAETKKDIKVLIKELEKQEEQGITDEDQTQ